MIRRTEVLLALALTVAIEVELVIRGDLGSPAHAVAAALITLPLALRFRWPLMTGAIVSVGIVAQMALSDSTQDPNFAMVAGLLAVYAIGSRATGWRFWLGTALAIGASCASSVIREGWTSDLAAAVAIPAVGLLIGRALG